MKKRKHSELLSGVKRYDKTKENRQLPVLFCDEPTVCVGWLKDGAKDPSLGSYINNQILNLKISLTNTLCAFERSETAVYNPLQIDYRSIN